MRVAVTSTYPPRPCGIGQFTKDLRAALLGISADMAVDIVSIVREKPRVEPPEVAVRIRQDVRSDYPAAAHVLNSRGTDVVLLEHEYGIFGGEVGSYVLSFVEELRQPLVVTLHTVLSAPAVRQAETLRALCERATLVTVFTETARRMVVAAHLAPPERVRVVPHGAPSMLLPDHNPYRSTQPALATRLVGGTPAGPRPALERLEGRTVLSTFGLISDSKGIEIAIKALPSIVAKHPDVLYLIAGQTHPEVVKTEGERYRLSLERLVRDLDLVDNVHFVDRFLSDDDLALLLGATDLYLTPYGSREQIVSGALTFAVVAGCPVVSTPYYYAEDLLDSGAGVLVPFNDPDALAAAVIGLIDDPAALAAARRVATKVGSELAWPSVGELTAKVLAEAIELGPVAGAAETPVTSAPQIRPDHLLTLVDDVGIIQHADGVVPELATGYCVDDVARLVIVAAGLSKTNNGITYSRMLTGGLSFLRYAWVPAVGAMHNLMSYERHWLDAPRTGDHVGRAAWALGVVLASEPPQAIAGPCRRLLQDMLPTLESLHHPRSVAYAAIGLSRPRSDVLGEPAEKLLGSFAELLLGYYHDTRREDWRWFADDLTYDNARLPQALIAAGRRLREPALVTAGVEALEWYADQCKLDTDAVRLIGNKGRRRGEVPAEDGDEQPIEAAALVEALVDALGATGDRAHGRRAVRAFEWFLGRNRLGVPVYDFATGGCHDGLGLQTVNDNEGAESTLAFLQALLALDAAGLQASLPQS
jgi:glycosyltransferase involved in cell wall biosynthesis